MIIARNHAGSLIDASAAQRGDTYTCPLCGAGPLTVKHGRIVVPHYAHPPSSACTEHEPESTQHIAMKRAAQALFGGQIEYILGNRRADVYSDAGIVIECQASPISIEEVAERTADWNHAGSDVLWIWRSGLLNKHSCWCDDNTVTNDEFERLHPHCELGCEHRIPAAILSTAVDVDGYSRIVVFNEATGRVMAAHLRGAGDRKTIRRFKLIAEVHGLTDGQELPIGGGTTIWTQHRTTDQWDICGHQRRLPAGLRLTTPTRYTTR